MKTPAQIAVMFDTLSPRERRSWIEQAVRDSGRSRGYYYRLAKAGGWKSGRRRRSDSGSLRAAVKEEELLKVARIKMEATRLNGKQTASTATAMSLLRGAPLSTLEQAPSITTVNRHLRRLGLGRKQVRRVRIFERVNKATGEARTYISEANNILCSDYPNQFHQVDTSVCILYSFGKTNQLKIWPENKLYKNKPQNFIRLINKRKIIIRYVLVDHCSAAFYVRYYEAGGENSSDMGDFLFHAWNRKSYPFHGAPEALGSDAGAGLNNRMLQTLLERLKVEWKPSLPGNKERNGLVEKTHDIFERQFEGFLKFDSVSGLEELNRQAEIACAFINNCKIHSGLGAPRSAIWSMIPQEKLREIPPVQSAFQRLMDLPAERKVAQSGIISFEGLAYRTDNPDLVGRTVTVYCSPYRYPAIEIYHAESDYRTVLEPVPTNKYGRLDVGANVARGTFNRLPDSETVRNVRRMLAEDISQVDARPLLESMRQAAAGAQFIGQRKVGSEIRIEAPEPSVFDTQVAAKKYLIETHGNPGPEILAALNDLLPLRGITVEQAEAAYSRVTAAPDNQESVYA